MNLPSQMCVQQPSAQNTNSLQRPQRDLNDRPIGLNEIPTITGVSVPTWYNLLNEDQESMPKRFYVGRRVFWWLSDIIAWLESKS